MSRRIFFAACAPVAVASVGILIASVVVLESLEKRGKQVSEGRHA